MRHALLAVMIFFIGAIQTKQPIKLKSNIQSDSIENSTGSFTPLDNSFRFKIDPKEVKDIESSDLNILKEKIDVIKDKVLDAKSKIMELTDTSLRSGRVDIPLAYLVIKHKNDMSSRFELINLTYILDGKKVFSDYDLYNNKEKELTIFDSMLTPGHHEVIVQAVYSGNAEGVFDYLNDYRLKIRGRYSFILRDGKRVTLYGIGYETGRIFTSFKDRPAIKFNTKEEILSKPEKALSKKK